MIRPGFMPMAISMPNSGVRSNTVIMKVLTMLKVTMMAMRAKNSRVPMNLMSMV